MHYMRALSLRVPPEYIQAMNKLVCAGYYPNRNELIRLAIRDLLIIHDVK